MYCLTSQNAWKTHLWTRVPGQLRRTALTKPVPPSETTTSDAGIGSIGADHALDVSERAMHHETMRSSLRHISTTRSRAGQIPSTKRTRCHSSSATGTGHSPQNQAVQRLNDLPCLGMSRWEPLDMSQPRNSRRAAALPSRRTSRRRFLRRLKEVIYLRIRPSNGHTSRPSAYKRRRVLKSRERTVHLQRRPRIGHTFCHITWKRGRERIVRAIFVSPRGDTMHDNGGLQMGRPLERI